MHDSVVILIFVLTVISSGDYSINIFLFHLSDILEHSLHQLLRQVHLNNVGQPVPHPSSAPLGPTKRRRLAGPHAYDRDELLLMTKKYDLFECVKQ